jgi:hypothetical protein
MFVGMEDTLLHNECVPTIRRIQTSYNTVPSIIRMVKEGDPSDRGTMPSDSIIYFHQHKFRIDALFVIYI